MTGPFMAVGTEDSIHDCAVVMRRTAHVSSHEYDIVLSVPAIGEAPRIGRDTRRFDNPGPHKENAFLFFYFFGREKGPRVHISMGDGAITGRH